jgi:shikimate kinase
MRIYLVGFMGSGKSTLGPILAEKLGLTFIDLDQRIESSERKSIPEIFAGQGENHFRKLERATLIAALKEDNFVLACGGGTPCFSDNMDLMKKTGLVLYLKFSPKKLSERLKNSGDARPLLLPGPGVSLENHISEMLEKREPFYKMANYTLKNPDAEELKDFILKTSNQ